MRRVGLLSVLTCVKDAVTESVRDRDMAYMDQSAERPERFLTISSTPAPRTRDTPTM